MGVYLGVSLEFIANRTLLLRLSPRALYGISCVLQGISPMLLMALAPKSIWEIGILGSAMGISMGLYFANRNFFTSFITQEKTRFAFISLDQTLTIIGGIISPLLIGGYITYAIETQHLLSSTAYLHNTHHKPKPREEFSLKKLHRFGKKYAPWILWEA